MNKQALFDRIKQVRDSLTNAMGGTTGAHIASTSILTGATAMTVAALARAIMQYKDKGNNYADIDASKYLDMAVTDPVVQQEHIDELTGRSKKAAINWVDTARWAAPIGSAVFAGTVGHTLMDKMYDQQADAKLKEEEAVLQSLNKKLSLARALNARGQLSDDAYNELMSQVQPYLDKKSSYIHKKADGKLDEFINTPADSSPWVAPAIGLTLALAFALSAYGSYHHDAARNPKRLQYKAIRKGLKEYAMNNGGMQPVDISLANDANTRELLATVDNKEQSASPRETPMTLAPVTI